MEVLAAAVVVFVAELGDKSQVMAAALAARFERRVLLAAVATTSALTIGVATLAGDLVGNLLPVRLTTVLAGLLFVGFGVRAWLADDDADDEEPDGLGGFVQVVATLTLAELGDKTMLATLGLSSVSTSPVWVWVGGTIGMTAAGWLGVLAGGWLWGRLRPTTVRRVSAGLFLVIGLLLVGVAVFGLEA